MNPFIENKQSTVSSKTLVFSRHIQIVATVSLLFLSNLIIVIDRVAVAQVQQVNEKDKGSDQASIDLFSAISVGILTGSVGILSAVLTAYINKNSTIESQIKNDLRDRVDVYSESFSLMLPLAIFSNTLKYYEEIQYISDRFTDWYYYKKGGLLMSRESQLAYIGFQATVSCILDRAYKQEEDTEEMDEMDTEDLYLPIMTHSLLV